MTTLSEVKSTIKAMGYKTNLKSYSDFKALSVLTADNQALNGVMTAETYAKHKALFEYVASVKGTIFDGFYRVVIA